MAKANTINSFILLQLKLEAIEKEEKAIEKEEETIDIIKGKAAFYAKKHNIRQDVVETMMHHDFIKYLNSKLA